MGELRGSPRVRTWNFHCRGLRSIPGRGNQDPGSGAVDINIDRYKWVDSYHAVFLLEKTFKIYDAALLFGKPRGTGPQRSWN